MSSLVLDVANVSASYGHVRVLHDISLDVREGELVSLLGRNGVGKSTLLKVLSGVLPMEKGKVTFKGIDISNKSYVDIVKDGIVQIPQERKVFSKLTVQDNLLLGNYVYKKSRAETNSTMDRIFELFPILAERQKQQAGTLSGGQQQMLAISRALMAKPKLLLLDEPSLGLAPMIVQDLFKIIERLVSEGLSVLLVEQNAQMALKISQRAFVMQGGQIVLQGLSENLLGSPELKHSFIGKAKIIGGY